MRDYRLPIRLLLLSLLLLPCGLSARDQSRVPTPYGLDYFRRPAPGAEEPVVLLRSAPEAARYRNLVEDTELEEGPYSPRLGETLIEEAVYLEQHGNHEAAIDSLRRAIHVTRINDGLHSAMQIPQVRRLLGNYLSIGELESADDAQHYLNFLALKAHPTLSPQGVAATVELSDWRRQTWLVKLHDRDMKHWYETYKLADEALEQLNEQDPVPVELLARLTYANLRQLYVLGEGEFGLREELQLALGRSFADEREQQISNEERMLKMLQKGSYARGRKRLEALVAAQKAAGNVAGEARAELYLADWHIWNDRSKRSLEHYASAWHLVQDPGLQSLRKLWFDDAQELPVDEAFLAHRQMQPADAVTVPMTLRFSVSDQGKARDVEVVELAEEHEAKGWRVKRLLRAARFRPLLQAGTPIDSPVLLREYLVRD